MKRHLFIVDPIAFNGGSKVATENILRLLNGDRNRITVLSADSDSWQWPGLQRLRLYQPRWLSRREQGLLYFLRHALIALQILWVRLRCGRVDTVLGASGPGVDLALYLLKPVLKFQLLQLVHGPVARSRTIARCLLYADEVHYLASAADSLNTTLTTLQPGMDISTLPTFHLMRNGLSSHAWPQPCQTERPVVFWAASLLKWKGLETLLTALLRFDQTTRPQTEICYIRPKDIALPISQAPIKIAGVHWHKQPDDLDRLRASANIFVSTSHSEPFGLSILEAMAAGHCILIPADGAYWDSQLENGVHCIKYRPGDDADLAAKLACLCRNFALVLSLGAAARKVAQHYRADRQYRAIKHALEHGVNKQPPHPRPPQARSETVL